MHWIIIFIITWVLFFQLIDKSEFKRNLLGGLFAFLIATIIDYNGTRMGLYKFYNVVIPWFGCSAFYKFGPILTMGILFSQIVPEKRWMQVLNILVFSLSFNGIEYLLIRTGNAQYFHWNIFASFICNMLTFTSLTWVITTFIRKSSFSRKSNS